MDIDNIQAQINFQKELTRTLELMLKKAKDEKRASVTPNMSYWIRPYTGTMLDRIYDDSVIPFWLEGELVNADECESVGIDIDHYRGGMVYLFNAATGKIIKADGGGRTYFNEWNLGEGGRELYRSTLGKIGDFIVNNPHGGEITEIVVGFKAAEKRIREER